MDDITVWARVRVIDDIEETIKTVDLVISAEDWDAAPDKRALLEELTQSEVLDFEVR